MKHFAYTVMGLLLSVTILSCDSIWSTETKLEFEEIHSVVYIDISKSRDSSSIIRSIDKMEEIFLAQEEDVYTRFIVKVIDKDNSVAPLFEYASEPLTDRRYDNISEFQENRENEAKSMREKIMYYFRTIAPNRKSSEQSCICNSIVNSMSYLNQLDTMRCKIQLLVFSDMYEECNQNSSVFKEGFSMCKGEQGRRNSMKKLLDIIQNYSTEQPLKNYVKPENLYFITDFNESYNATDKVCLNSQEVKKLWREILVKFGYNQQEVDKIVIDNLTPSRLLKKSNDV